MTTPTTNNIEVPPPILPIPPEELKKRFVIPREYIRQIAAWMDLSESMTYQILRQERKPSKRTAANIEQRTGLPSNLWDTEDIDILCEMVYTYWYNYFCLYHLT